MSTAVATELQALEAMDLSGLRAEWRRRYGDPPRLRSVDLLRRIIAWRIQVAAYGGLDRQTRQALARSSPAATRAGLAPGTRLTREYQGVRHDVTVTETGFRYDGMSYASLSAVARKITGQRWNGWRFFGLAEAG